MFASFPPATLFGTHTHRLASSFVDQEYEISVWLPPDYDASPDKTYPVLYVLDGDVNFGVAVSSVWMLVAGQDVPPMIVIAVGYHITGFDDWAVRRARDFCPVEIEALPGSKDGGSADFLSFIDSELIPFVNANYRTDPNNLNIWGHSGGGVFALYALLQKPGLFRGIISGSPMTVMAPAPFYDMEKALAESGQPLPAKAYFAFGALEWPDAIKSFEDLYRTIESRNYEGLSLKYERLDNETHTSVIARLFITGLREIFKP